VATRLFAGVHGIPLHQLRSDFRSADRAEPSRADSGEKLSARCSVNLIQGQQARSVMVDDLPPRPKRAGVDVALVARPKTLPIETYDLTGLWFAVAQRPRLP